jgi:hypothetical protein
MNLHIAVFWVMTLVSILYVLSYSIIKGDSAVWFMVTNISEEHNAFMYKHFPYTVRTIISAPPLQNAVSHTTAERMQLLLCRSPIARV